MKHKPSFGISHPLARMSIWTIVHHQWLAGQIRFYIWCATATVLFLSIASIIPLTIALTILLFCGTGMLILLWSLIRWRRSILLSIRDEKLKQRAHAAMLALIRSKPSAAIKTGPSWRWRNNKYHP